MQMGIFFDQSRCTGCFTCVIACKDWNDIPAGPVSWRRIFTLESGKFPDLFATFLSTSCYHCINPQCADACPVSAIIKREQDGIVVVESELCLGKKCQLCLDACPYGIPQFGPEEDAKMQKCDLCVERLNKGEKPICVNACPMRALDVGPLEELEEKYRNIRETVGFIYFEDAAPSVIFKPKEASVQIATENVIISQKIRNM